MNCSTPTSSCLSDTMCCFDATRAKALTLDNGKGRGAHGRYVQAIMLPDGLPIWTSEALPGHLHDISRARDLGVTAALN